MIRVEEAPAPAAARSADRQVVPLPLCGPQRHPDLARALRLDLDDIVALQGGVLEQDLQVRGWTTAQIIEYLPAARRIGQPEIDRP